MLYGVSEMTMSISFATKEILNPLCNFNILLWFVLARYRAVLKVTLALAIMTTRGY